MIIASCRFAPCSPTHALAVRNGARVMEADGEWCESYSSNAFSGLLNPDKPPAVYDRHDGFKIGYVSVPIAGRTHWTADLIIEDAWAHLIEVGTPVSLSGGSYRKDENPLIRVRRELVFQLDSIDLVPEGQEPVYADARVTSIWRSKPKAAPSPVDWRTKLPVGWHDFANTPNEIKVGDMLFRGRDQSGGIVWDGSKFTTKYAAAAA
jgi:hypothetical protein